MKLISHRGNLNEILPEKENSPQYIDEAIQQGYDVEIDIRLINNVLYLGHDTPDYKVTLEFLKFRRDYLWVHCKNFAVLSYLVDSNLRIFFHQKEDHSIINNCDLIWSHKLSEANERSIIPLLSSDDILEYHKYKHVYGICSDFISRLG